VKVEALFYFCVPNWDTQFISGHYKNDSSNFMILIG